MQQMIEACVSCLTSFVLLAVYTMLLILLDWKLLLVFMLCTMLDIIVMKKTKDYEAGCRGKLAAVGRRKGYLFQIMSDYRFGKELRIFGMEGILQQKYQGQCRKGLEVRMQIEQHRTGGEMMGAFLDFVAQLAIYVMLFLLYLRKGLTADDFVMYIGIAASFHTVSRTFVETGTNMILLSSSIVDYRCFVEGNRYVLEEGESDAFHTVSRNCTVVFEDVSFTYPGNDRKTLDHVSFTLEPGRQISLVGENGAGKSTIVRLLCGFYEPDEGRILLNGKDIKDYDKEEYLAQISAVFQESTLYSGTLEENICLGREANQTHMREAFRMVGMEEKIRKLPMQEKSNVLKYIHDDGIEFSGGEKQRLCIARAVYKDSGLLLLDEPTAALDALAEKEIYESFSRISSGRTVLFISHRLNSNRLCDKVIFMEKGHVCAQGSHEELIDSCEAYRDMYNLQAQYYVKREMVL
ncbi:MAG: ABC transporter ATP-binding protein [Lachnospiraceae bacterium]|nr:ABC transporter ATP-binding protein [Lachnospiraceae bacterium]